MLRSATGALLGLRRSTAGLLALAPRCFSTAAAAAAPPAASPPSAASAAAAASSSSAAAPAAAAARDASAGGGVELQAVRRDLDGSRHAQYARRHGLIPGLVYSAASSKGGGTLKVYVKEADLRREVNRAKASFLNTLITLVVDGVRYRVLPRDLQLHPFRPKLVCCNWYKYSPGKSPGVKVDIPLVTSNEERCQAYREGGWLLQLVHKLPVFAFGDAIPASLVMDLRGRRIGEKIMASDINLGGTLALRFRDQDFAVAKFVGSGKKGAAVAAAEPAAKAAAPKAAAAAAGGDKAKAAPAAAAAKA